MENKYYTPTTEEFHIGFEYEMFEDFDVPFAEKAWHKLIYGINGTHNPETLTYPLGGNMDNIRVKYLDREDIESLGWEHDMTTKKDGEHYNIGHTMTVRYWFMIHKENHIHIWDANSRLGGTFIGILKNKSELKRIMNQLNIQP